MRGGGVQRITAFDASELEQRSITRLDGLAAAAPGLEIGTGSFGNDASDAVIFLRGVGQNDVAVFTDPAVGIYLDGIYLARAQGALLDLVDIERVEILRGPRGTLFGKNTTGGAIQIVTRRPAETFAVDLGACLGNFRDAGVRAMVDGRLGGVLFGSLALRGVDSDGWSRSAVTGQQFHDQQRSAVRAALAWAPEPGSGCVGTPPRSSRRTHTRSSSRTVIRICWPAVGKISTNWRGW